MSAEDVYEAVKHGDLEAVRRAVEANPSLKEEPYNDLTPLRRAAYYGHVGIVRYLVGEAGADKDKVGLYGATPLLYAAEGGHLGVVRYLAGEAGADKDKASVVGYTPLMRAAIFGHLEVVRYLLEKGADATLANIHGRTTLVIAEYNGHVEIAALIREYLPGGIMDQRRNAVQTSVLNQKDLGPDVAWFCSEFIMKLT